MKLGENKHRLRNALVGGAAAGAGIGAASWENHDLGSRGVGAEVGAVIGFVERSRCSSVAQLQDDLQREFALACRAA